MDQRFEDVAVDLGPFLSPASFWLPERVITSAWLQHGPFAFWLVDALRPRRVVELGTHHGYSYLAFCQAVRRLGYPAQLFAVDTWAGDEHAGAYAEGVLRELRAYHDPRFADISRLVQSRFDEAVAHFEDGSVDLLHVDGRHFYEDAKEDYEIWQSKLSDRAVVLFHDTNVRERNFGVWRLWADLAGHHPSFEFRHGHGLGVLGVGRNLPPRVAEFFNAGIRHPGAVRETYLRLGSAIEDRHAAGTAPAQPRTAAAPAQPRTAVAPAQPRTAAAPATASPSPAAGIPLHIHVAAMAPRFLDVRTHLPLTALAGRPGITTSLSERKIDLPRLPPEMPKVLVLQRAALGEIDRWKGIVRDIVGRGWLIVTELDDHPELLGAVHNVPVDDAAWRGAVLAHAVQTSTPALAEAIRPHNPEVAVFPNCAFTLARTSRRPSPDGRVRVFFGALNRERFSRQVGAALAAYAAAHREVEFVVVHDRAFFDALGDCTKSFHPAQPYDGYLRLMAGCDVALMPLEGAPGERYKSDVKWVEASALGLATVASPLVYGESLRDGVTGLLAVEVADWPVKVSALLANPDMRASVAESAHREIVARRTFATQADVRLAWYHSLWRERWALTEQIKKRFATVV